MGRHKRAVGETVGRPWGDRGEIVGRYERRRCVRWIWERCWDMQEKCGDTGHTWEAQFLSRGGSNRLVAKGCKEKVLGTPTHTHLGWVCGHPLLAEDDRVCVREETAGGGRVTVRTLRTLHAVDRHGGAEAFEGLLELAHAWASRQGAAHQLQALALLLLVRWRGRRGRRLRVHRRMKKW